MNKILVIDDEKFITWSLKQGLEKEGYDVTTSGSGEEGLEIFKSETPDITLLDVHLSGMDGIKTLELIKELDKDALVIMITAHGGVEGAVKAIKLGAYDYIEKPFDLDRIKILIKKALETVTLKKEVRQLRGEQQEKYSFEKIAGYSESMQKMIALARKIAGSDATTVLIQGESGVGKDLMAKTIHYNSARTDKPFIEVTCTALPETLVESELFGYEKGAFTDAKVAKKGLFELAEGGTIYLDEIGDMKPSTQAKILRVVEEHTFKRIGGLKDIKVDLRIIAATNKDLGKAVKEGNFREDLYYRLKVIPIYVPPLKERKEDIIPLIMHFAAVFGKEIKKEVKGITPEVEELLMNYPWPGNIRELKNIVERLCILGSGNVIDLQYLPAEIADYSHKPITKEEEGKTGEEVQLALPKGGISLEDLEKDFIRQALQMANGNQTKAAKLLRLTRDALRYRMQKFGYL